MENQYYEHILKALRIANDLLDLANTEEMLANDSCSILSGVMRDCAFKIRRTVEREYLPNVAIKIEKKA
ncbi:MAG: hypothetical protein AMJ43_07160 [Coxiella sp. DG_40]|nr:MAG: hypothetical protein AMJ43_07160 [Coxiella sp. DG_40]